eukprot:COSAG05_NODE_17362_length_326_cov_1.127753_1_plen_72_part_01
MATREAAQNALESDELKAMNLVLETYSREQGMASTGGMKIARAKHSELPTTPSEIQDLVYEQHDEWRTVHIA